MNQKTLRKLLEWIIIVGLFFAIGYFISTFGVLDKIELEGRSDKIVAIIGLVIIIHLALGIHELGHFLVGLWQGFRFQLYVVGLLGVKREEDKVKVYLNKNMAYYGGVAATSPVEASEDNAKKFANILLAGPMASLIFAIVCFLLALGDNSILRFVFFTGGLASIGIFIATTVPSKTGMFFTDRKRYQRLIRPGKDQEVELALLNIMGTFAKDNSYRNVDYKNIELLRSDQLPFIKFFGLFNAICYQLELTGTIEDEVLNDYQTTSKDLSKSMAMAFDKEIEKYKEVLQLQQS